jgi:hypothetical protein
MKGSFVEKNMYSYKVAHQTEADLFIFYEYILILFHSMAEASLQIYFISVLIVLQGVRFGCISILDRNGRFQNLTLVILCIPKL